MTRDACLDPVTPMRAQVAYLVESDGALVTQWLRAELLRPVG